MEKSQPLNFYQPSEGSSENLQVQNDLDNDNLNDSGEIIYQQDKNHNEEKRTYGGN